MMLEPPHGSSFPILSHTVQSWNPGEAAYADMPQQGYSRNQADSRHLQKETRSIISLPYLECSSTTQVPERVTLTLQGKPQEMGGGEREGVNG